jgi:hypothetical protein
MPQWRVLAANLCRCRPPRDFMARLSVIVMAGFMPAIHVLLRETKKDVDGI